jgi:hypothetical protein
VKWFAEHARFSAKVGWGIGGLVALAITTIGSLVFESLKVDRFAGAFQSNAAAHAAIADAGLDISAMRIAARDFARASVSGDEAGAREAVAALEAARTGARED